MTHDIPLDKTIRVFVVDDHPMIRSGIAAMLRTGPDLVLVGEADSGASAVELAGAAQADVVLMDLMMPHMDGIEAAAMLLRRHPAIKVVMMTGQASTAEVQRATTAGASGYMLKTASARELVDAIRSVHAGFSLLAPALADTSTGDPHARSLAAELTAREIQVLGAMVRGLSNQQIADEIAVALPTVKFHISNILSKLHVGSRTQAVLSALRHKLVDVA
jgi:two-component system, NarL family, response regulator LiaR